MVPEVTPRAASRGFTLIELVIVMMVIGILATLLTPRYRQSVLKAEGATVSTRLEAINVALKEYEADHDSLPTETGTPGTPPPWLAPYLAGPYFSGPGDVTMQYVKASPTTHASIVVAAGTVDERQILLAAAASLGNAASVVGGGASLVVQLTE